MQTILDLREFGHTVMQFSLSFYVLKLMQYLSHRVTTAKTEGKNKDFKEI